MRIITFQEVGMENYGPYTDPMILTFDNDTLTLVTGPNGIGKTMAIDAIPFTLYGTTSKGAKGDDVVNNKVGKNCKTWVKFMVNDEQYLVTRYHKYTKYQNTVIINHNGVDIKQGHREVLPYIERIVCPEQAFMNSLMFGQKVKDFFTDLIDSKKKEIFRKLLDLGMFLIYYKGADQAYKDIEAQSHDIKNTMQVKIGLINDAIQQIELLTKKKNDFYNDRENEIKDLQKLMENTNRLLSKWEEDLLEARSKDVDLESTIMEFAKIDDQINDLLSDDKQALGDLSNRATAKIAELKAKAQQAQNEISEKYNDLLSNLQAQRSDIKEAIASVIRDLQDSRHTMELEKTTLSNTCDSIRDRVTEIQSHVIDADISECPLCEQSVDEHTIKMLEKKIEDYNVESFTAQAQIQVLSDSIQDNIKELKRVTDESNEKLKHNEAEDRQVKRAKQDELEQLSKKFMDASDKVNALAKEQEQEIIEASKEKSKELEKRKIELSDKRKIQETNIQNVRNAEDNIMRLKQDYTQAQKDIKKLEETEYDETQLNSYLAKEVTLTREIEASRKRVEQYDMFLEVAQFWKSGFSSAGIPSMLIDEAIPYMNERVEHYLDMLTNGRYVVSFDTLAETKAGEFRDKISVHVLDTQTRANSRVQLSGGQTRIIDIAIILTLGDLLSRIQNVSFNILLFDEIFDALDEQNIQYVSKVLSKIKIGKAVYIISHQHQDHLEADQTLAFT
jgi:DNA repair exonuclease SbcCD ATPase subunit